MTSTTSPRPQMGDELRKLAQQCRDIHRIYSAKDLIGRVMIEGDDLLTVAEALEFLSRSRASTPTEKEAGRFHEVDACKTCWRTRAAHETRGWDCNNFEPRIERTRSASVTDALQKRPVAFRVRDNEEEGCEWAIFLEEENAAKHAERCGVEYQGLYVRTGAPSPPQQGAAARVTGWLKEDMERASARGKQWQQELSPPQQDGSGLVEARKLKHAFAAGYQAKEDGANTWLEAWVEYEPLTSAPKASDHAPARAESVALTQTEEEA